MAKKKRRRAGPLIPLCPEAPKTGRSRPRNNPGAGWEPQALLVVMAMRRMDYKTLANLMYAESGYVVQKSAIHRWATIAGAAPTFEAVQAMGKVFGRRPIFFSRIPRVS